MKGDLQVAPMPVGLVGSNWFNHGWLYGVLGLPEPQWADTGVDGLAALAFRDGRRAAEAGQPLALTLAGAIATGRILAVRGSDV